jgi:hypothetical protein
MEPEARILSQNALRGVSIGISVSQSADLARLGLTEGHLRLTLGEIARSMLVLGGGIAYGGHLDPGGFTVFLLSELKRYGRKDRPFRMYLPWAEHRRVPLSRLADLSKDLGLYASVVCLDPEGKPVDPALGRTEAPAVEVDRVAIARSLTAMRIHMGNVTQGRVLIGGKRHGFQGVLPGLIEEALLSFEKGWPVYLAGGFGGVTLDILRALNEEDAAWLPETRDSPPPDSRWLAGIESLKRLSSDSKWGGCNNGLTDQENRRLAATHRPSDVAALVSMGLGRLAAEGRFRNQGT